MLTLCPFFLQACNYPLELYEVMPGWVRLWRAQGDTWENYSLSGHQRAAEEHQCPPKVGEGCGGLEQRGHLGSSSALGGEWVTVGVD